MKEKVHYLEVFSLPDIYPKYGLVWQMACMGKVYLNNDDYKGTTEAKDVTCERCKKFLDVDNEGRLRLENLELLDIKHAMNMAGQQPKTKANIT